MKKSEEIIDTAKQEAKEKLAKMVKEYFANNTKAIENKKYTIDNENRKKQKRIK